MLLTQDQDILIRLLRCVSDVKLNTNDTKKQDVTEDNIKKLSVSEDSTKLKKPPSSFRPELQTESAQVSYRTVQWDESLLQSAGKTPAGPLFNIQCPEAAVCELHLPHCETKDALQVKGLLSVVHISNDGLRILEPQEITDTHVVVKPINCKVLLFLRSPVRRHRVLDVFLLPTNIPLSEVKAQHGDAKYIKTSSSCRLMIGQSYSVHCESEDLEIQPECAEFHPRYGLNYFPTFEVFLTSNQEEVTVMIQDPKRTEVWGDRMFFCQRETVQSIVHHRTGCSQLRHSLLAQVSSLF
ncbi:NACHT, LRR and PYD domains-containing protein 1-like protein [Lates japonicus]|uniref:NACHT, LRR and PYD domains-containing protein 1-like protein n=1 Tax=Lates japonicus TaxID=270547 RepID=A0AAD3REH4_LATJO|nr:NACHT, LRR and PYD domains-containing protein 1-like protein [Lates japonicus]